MAELLDLEKVLEDVDEVYISMKDRVAVSIAIAHGLSIKDGYNRIYQSTRMDHKAPTITVNPMGIMSEEAVRETYRLLSQDDDVAQYFALCPGWELTKVKKVGDCFQFQVSWSLARYALQQ